MTHYFSSDWHLGHANIIKYDNRPFANTDEMDNAIIENYNAIVKPDDEFYFLGDFAFKNVKETEGYLSRLNGKLFFIKGNHDSSNNIELFKKYGTYLGQLAEVRINGQLIVLCHYAMRVWNQSHRGAWHLYGHSHHSLEDLNGRLSFDVGVNGHNYKPLSFGEIEARMNTKEFTPIDHHK